MAHPRPQPGERLDRADDLVADHDVCADVRLLLGGQLPCLEQHLVADAYLAHIV